MNNTTTFNVPEAAQGQRLDLFLSENLPHVSREKIKKAVQSGHCSVDGECVTLAKTRVLGGQHILLRDAAPLGADQVQAEAGDVDCLWQDEHLALLNKPCGLTVHPCPSCPEGTLVHRLVGHFPQLRQQEGPRPGIVHRLDKDTSGLMLIALTERARLHMSAAFAEHGVHKHYLALVHGVPPLEGEVDAPLGRHPTVKVKMAVLPEEQGGRPALSHWRNLYSDPDGRFALLCVRIFTGRTHQIRVHMTHAGYPLWGDSLYGPRVKAGDYAPPRQMLHAWQLAFLHPVSGESMDFTCPPPQDFVDCFTRLAWKMQKVVITGSPGCGKSALLEALEREGLPVWSADSVLRAAYKPQGDAWLFLRQRYGDSYLAPDLSVNKTALREAMQFDPRLKKEVEAHTHALARHDLELFWQKCAAGQQDVAVAEVPLYLEARWQTQDKAAPTHPATSGKPEKPGKPGLPAGSDIPAQGMDRPLLVGVDCPSEQRLHRVQTSRGWDAAVLDTLDSWQWPAARKLAACDVVTDNSGTLEELQAQAKVLMQNLEGLRKEYAAQCLAKTGVLQNGAH